MVLVGLPSEVLDRPPKAVDLFSASQRKGLDRQAEKHGQIAAKPSTCELERCAGSAEIASLADERYRDSIRAGAPIC